jgi:acetyl esterase/lipase
MNSKVVYLIPDHPECTLTVFLREDVSDRHPTVVICPGGGYGCVCSDREGYPIAEFYSNAGFNTCILEYTVAPKTEEKLGYLPAIEVGLAIKYMREHADELGVDTERIFTCGFSAGGHLAASAGILWDRPEVLAAMGDAPIGINRPNGMILSYPVITAGKHAHRGSIANLLKKPDYTEEEGNIFSLEKHVNPNTPPMFIWHTVTDTCVPIRNATLLIDAYLENGVSFEAHIFPKGPHGLALANEITWGNNPDMYDLHVANWIGLSAEWVKKF